jgi:enterochelin esterase-like enzyme
MKLSTVANNNKVNEQIFKLDSVALNRTVHYHVFKCGAINEGAPVNLLLLNDGQDTEHLKLRETLNKLANEHRIRPLIAVAIHANHDRLQEYGTAGRPDFKQRGAKAHAYTQFIKSELLPQLEQKTGIGQFTSSAFAGFSLGGLSALDISWANPQLFDKVGVFSGSLWWRSKALDQGYTDNDRIMHQIIRNTSTKPKLKFWLQTGTMDETADRNKNGIIDSIDDTIDLIKELENKGYCRPSDIQYLEVVGGRHHADTWAAVMPKFLCWAFGR